MYTICYVQFIINKYWFYLIFTKYFYSQVIHLLRLDLGQTDAGIFNDRDGGVRLSLSVEVGWLCAVQLAWGFAGLGPRGVEWEYWPRFVDLELDWVSLNLRCDCLVFRIVGNAQSIPRLLKTSSAPSVEDPSQLMSLSLRRPRLDSAESLLLCCWGLPLMELISGSNLFGWGVSGRWDSPPSWIVDSSSWATASTKSVPANFLKTLAYE